MLTREQQRLLGAAGSPLAASGLLDEVRQRDTFEGGRSVPQASHWISYNRKAIWLEDHSEFRAALKAAGDDPTAVRRFRPAVLVKATWAEVAAHGAALPRELREELAALRIAGQQDDQAWCEFSGARGGFPWRRNFATDDVYAAARAEWDERYAEHIAALIELRDRTKAAVARALPLIEDDEPMDLLELLDQQPAPAKPPAVPLQAAVLRQPRPVSAAQPPQRSRPDLPGRGPAR